MISNRTVSGVYSEYSPGGENPKRKANDVERSTSVMELTILQAGSILGRRIVIRMKSVRSHDRSDPADDSGITTKCVHDSSVHQTEPGIEQDHLRPERAGTL